jgi:hypothetical protein
MSALRVALRIGENTNEADQLGWLAERSGVFAPFYPTVRVDKMRA